MGRLVAAHAWVLGATLCSTLLGCATRVAPPSTPLVLSTAQQVQASAARARVVMLPGVGACDAPARRAISVAPDRALVLLVHGMHSTADGLRVLADSFRAAGQQTLCFRYDGRESLLRSARRLRSAIVVLARELTNRDVVVLGHSQGGLVARAALSTALSKRLPRGSYRLVTVAAPFAGIRIARSCGSIPYHIASFGVSYAVCRAISGASWNQIHPRASMVRSPAALDAAVAEHLLILTDERESCRRYSADGLRCVQDDYVFSLQEQRNARITRDLRVSEASLQVGHVEVMGSHGPPTKLIDTLQRRGFLGSEPVQRAAVFDDLSAKSW